MADPSGMAAVIGANRGARTAKTGAWLVPLLLITALTQNYSELQSLMDGGRLFLSEIQGPIFVRLLKDLVYISVIFSVAAYSFTRKKNPLTVESAAIVLLIIVSFFLSFSKNDLLTSVIGLRWATPLLIFLFIHAWSSSFDGTKSLLWIYLGILICLLLQIYQLFYMPPVYGTIFGLSARAPGMFIAPNSTSFFGCACAAFVHVFARGNFRHLLTSTILAVLITALAQSGTGAIVCVAFLLHTFFTGSRIIIIVFFVILAPAVFFNLDGLLGRDSFVELSGGGRIERFAAIVRASAYDLGNFGYYTNASNLADANPQFRYAVDSLWASMIGNFGVFAPFVIGFVAIFVFRQMRGVDLDLAFSPMIVFFAFSFTTIIFEAYPMNIIVILSIWGAKKIASERVPRQLPC